MLTAVTADPPCPVPSTDQPPANGALVCGAVDHYYPRACRVHCREGYELRRHDADHKFVCRWDGTWTINGPWPDCYCTRAFDTVQLYTTCTLLGAVVVSNFFCSNNMNYVSTEARLSASNAALCIRRKGMKVQFYKFP